VHSYHSNPSHALRGREVGWLAMTRKITMKALEPLDGAEQDFAALADQWIDRNWYLPPGGDHS